jgi:CheY-like chemotaxis protein
VATATSGERGLRLAHEYQPAAITLDVMMPVMDGFSFLAAIRARPKWRHIPVIVVTAKNLTSEDHARLNGMVEDVLEKNAYSREDLLEHVREAVASCSIRHKKHWKRR